MGIGGNILKKFRNEQLQKITGVFGLHLRKKEYDVNRMRGSTIDSGFCRLFSEAAIHAWIEGRNIPGDEVLSKLAQHVGLKSGWVKDSSNKMDIINSFTLNDECVTLLDKVMGSHDVDGLEQLLDAGLPVDLIYRDEKALLHSTIQDEWYEGAKTLVAWGASTDSFYDDALIKGQTENLLTFLPHCSSELGGLEGIIKRISSIPGDHVTLLRQHFEKIHREEVPYTTSTHDNEALFLAIKAGNTKIAECLLKFGQHADLFQFGNDAPLTLAAEYDNAELIDALLRAGANIGKAGTNPIIRAALAGASSKTLHTLIARGFAGAGEALILCKSAGLEDQIAALQSAPANGPTWYRQAKKRGIRQITLYMDKANGLLFFPQKMGDTLGIGGSYDGNGPMGAVNVAQILTEPVFKYDPVGRNHWFLPYILKMANLEDFSLDEILSKDVEKVVYVEGREPQEPEPDWKRFEAATKIKQAKKAARKAAKREREAHQKTAKPVAVQSSSRAQPAEDVSPKADIQAEKPGSSPDGELKFLVMKVSIVFLITAFLLIVPGWFFGFAITDDSDSTFFISGGLMFVIGAFVIFLETLLPFPLTRQHAIAIGVLTGLWVIFFGHSVATDLHADEVQIAVAKNPSAYPDRWNKLDRDRLYVAYLESVLGKPVNSRILGHLNFHAKKGLPMRQIYSSSQIKIERGFSLWSNWAFQILLIMAASIAGAIIGQKAMVGGKGDG